MSTVKRTLSYTLIFLATAIITVYALYYMCGYAPLSAHFMNDLVIMLTGVYIATTVLFIVYIEDCLK